MAPKKAPFLIHFYMDDNRKYFERNLNSRYKYWSVVGTDGHGRQWPDGTTSSVSVLNCFSLDWKFFEVVDEYPKIDRFSFGIVLSRKMFEKECVVDVQCEHIDPSLITEEELHHYDAPHARTFLSPFNHCNVVRIEHSDKPAPLPDGALIGLVVPHGYVGETKEQLRDKGLSDIWVTQLQHIKDKLDS